MFADVFVDPVVDGSEFLVKDGAAVFEGEVLEVDGEVLEFLDEFDLDG